MTTRRLLSMVLVLVLVLVVGRPADVAARDEAPPPRPTSDVAPGLIESNMTRGMKGIDALEKPEIERTLMHRWGTPEDVAPTFLYLASAAARFVTGQTWCVDGGYSVA